MIFKLKWLKKYFEKDGNQFDNIREGKEDSGFRIEADADENTPNKDVIKFDGEDEKTIKNLRPIWWKFEEETETPSVIFEPTSGTVSYVDGTFQVPAPTIVPSGSTITWSITTPDSNSTVSATGLVTFNEDIEDGGILVIRASITVEEVTTHADYSLEVTPAE